MNELTWEQEQDINDYLAWKAEHDWQEHNQRPLTDSQIEAEYQDLVEGMEDEAFWSRGGW